MRKLIKTLMFLIIIVLIMLTNGCIVEELPLLNKNINIDFANEMFGDISSRIIQYADFYNKEKTGGELDIKQDPFVWDKAFNNEILYPDISRFRFDDIVVDKAELGNIIYGYWGKSMGFSDRELFYGGGVANVLNQKDSIISSNENKFIGYVKAGLNTLSKLVDINYGDEAKDLAAIMKGIELYNKVNNFDKGCGR